MFKAVVVLACTLLIACTAIVAVERLDLAQIQDVPWGASPDEGDNAEDVRASWSGWRARSRPRWPSFGDPAGDSLLARLGERLATTMDGIGRAHRMGGDEFCVTAPAAAGGAEAIASLAAAVVDAFTAVVAERALV